MSEISFSFEFFPPRSQEAERAFRETRRQLIALGPSLVTVTYGALGSGQARTMEAVSQLAREHAGTPVGCHLTYLNATREHLRSYADALWANGIRHIVAVRGDLPDDLTLPLDQDERYFQYTSDFVGELSRWHPFTIFVGAYPEKHPDSAALADDVEALKYKLDAGAHGAITQFFFDNDRFLSFLETCRSKGMDKPIIPGLIPIYSFRNVCSFAAKCKASVPTWLHEKFAPVEDGSEEAIALATEILTEQVQDLRARGIREFHFFSMNRHPILKDVVEAALR